MTRTEVDALLAKYPAEVSALAASARAFLERLLPEAEESVQAGIIGYRYGPGYKGLVCTLILSRTGVKLGIVRGAELPDPTGLMTGSGKVHRHVQLRGEADLDRPGLEQLVQRAHAATLARMA